MSGLYGLAADAVVVFHLFYVLFAVGGDGEAGGGHVGSSPRYHVESFPR